MSVKAFLFGLREMSVSEMELDPCHVHTHLQGDGLSSRSPNLEFSKFERPEP